MSVWKTQDQSIGTVTNGDQFKPLRGNSGNDSTEVYVCVLVTWSCPTLCDPMDCSPPGSSIHGLLQARRLGWVATPFSMGSSNPGTEFGFPVNSLLSEALC